MTMNHDLDIDTHDLDWMAGRQSQRISAEPFVAGDPFARERALRALVRHIDPERGRRRLSPRRLLGARTLGFAATAGAVALLAVVVLSSGGDATHGGAGQGDVPHGGAVAQAGAGHGPLMKLADYVSTSPQPTGDATVIERTTTSEGKTWTGFDLYDDTGRYFFAETKEGLAGVVAAGESEGGGTFARELAAAEAATTGDARAAAEAMAIAPNPKQEVTPADGSHYDNAVWEWSLQAIVAGAGRPEIRAGVLKILGTLPGITVREGVAAGTPTLVLTAGPAEFGAGYTEALTIDAETGVPLKFVGSPTGGPPATEVEYRVSRADYPALAAPGAATE
jgi:hypothetical protein